MKINGLLARARSCEEERRVIDQLRDVGLDQYIELPQIAVMGDTSSGKSSLLSALSGVSFPSNDQLTTRCPTQLILTRADTFRGTVRLVRYQSGSENGEGEEKQDLNRLKDVPDSITKLTQKLVDEGQYISDDQIVIEMCGPELPNLTLTDLPGLVRTVGDHEDQSLIPRVRQMVDRYMKQEQTVIIAVVPANVDMHNTEILQAAQEADPNGTRTIAVVTKVDLVDAGAELAVHELLLNKKKKMRLGYHAVKCRNQRELAKGTSIEKGLANEMAFFRQHEYWSRLPTHLWGVQRLTERLVSILEDNIRRSLPKVIDEISARMSETQKQLLKLGTTLKSPGAQRQQFGKWVNQYLRLMEAAMTGQYELLSPNGATSMPEARLRAVLRRKDRTFREEIEASKTSDTRGTDVLCEELPHEWLGATRWKFASGVMAANGLKQFIQANRGDELAIFPSYRVFCSCVQRSLRKWERPALELLERYYSHTKSTSHHLISTVLAGSESTRVERFFKRTTDRVLGSLKEVAARELQLLLQHEARPYTQDQRLYEELDSLRQRALHARLEAALPRGDKYGMVSLANVTEALGGISMASDDREALEMGVALRAYLEVASHRFIDVVPMKLNGLLLDSFVREMESELLGAATDEKVAELLRENSDKAARRQQLVNELCTLEKGKMILEMSEF
ncbi:interferon-induced GTP-binding protein Mx [Phytophthora infestans T30-4]|uniref:Interferon-induced GTP-binding protein Mx n=1 Tax=Phytophthora infestans (strain T30-4) TaxID=403677 RepID=D0NDA9_PHYIT|nr:interferon-induced GTP-binding protein Mx [Phytophthora infestans T30-4]EEY56066.1 interferon-induced GTP-binding protein Mx [Phytophthora infestans T30-4]|eukprot:XP_002902896.1 interferon-induced GTP-binding protein Mx [Phytophthora infestans T30-4]